MFEGVSRICSTTLHTKKTLQRNTQTTAGTVDSWATHTEDPGFLPSLQSPMCMIVPGPISKGWFLKMAVKMAESIRFSQAQGCRCSCGFRLYSKRHKGNMLCTSSIRFGLLKLKLEAVGCSEILAFCHTKALFKMIETVVCVYAGFHKWGYPNSWIVYSL